MENSDIYIFIHTHSFLIFSITAGLENYGPSAKSFLTPIFVHKVFIGTEPCLFIYALSVDDFVL